MKKGLFITFEGVDGSGKTTQLNKIKSLLEEKGLDVLVTREPGALLLGQKIRDMLLHSEEKVSDTCETFLFLADRAQHVEMLIKPALAKGKVVLCDRYIDSTIAYQGYGRKHDVNLLKHLNSIVIDNLIPDLTLLFDVSTDTALQRLGNEKDRMESTGIEFHKNVRAGYLELLKENPQRIKLINANNSTEIVYNETKSIILELLTKERGE